MAETPASDDRGMWQNLRAAIPYHMTLGAGSRFGSYDITAEIGAGGMGVVYRARDTRLTRVAQVIVDGAAFKVGAVQPLFQTRGNAAGGSSYDVSADDRILINTVVDDANAATVSLVVNWTSLLNW